MTTETKISRDDALRALTQEYMEEIRSLAKEAMKQPKRDRDDWLHETIDGHEWVIYTHKARVVLICTDNPDAYEDEMGDKPAGPEQAAYKAMMTDVREMMGAMDTEEDSDE